MMETMKRDEEKKGHTIKKKIEMNVTITERDYPQHVQNYIAKFLEKGIFNDYSEAILEASKIGIYILKRELDGFNTLSNEARAELKRLLTLKGRYLTKSETADAMDFIAYLKNIQKSMEELAERMESLEKVMAELFDEKLTRLGGEASLSTPKKTEREKDNYTIYRMAAKIVERLAEMNAVMQGIEDIGYSLFNAKADELQGGTVSADGFRDGAYAVMPDFIAEKNLVLGRGMKL